jgi:hypothetical protein
MDSDSAVAAATAKRKGSSSNIIIKNTRRDTA